jgi:O-antigen/teichoic acid export membrane protein
VNLRDFFGGRPRALGVPEADPVARREMFRPTLNLLTGTLTKYVLLGVNIVIGILLMPFTIHHLGKAEYGLWMLAASMTAYLQLLDLGYGNGLVRQITQADARGDEDEMNVILSTFFVVYCAIGLAALAGVAGLALFVLPRFPNLSPADVRIGQWILAILGLRIATAFPMSVFGAVTTARQRFALTGWIAIAFAVAQGAATYLVLRAGYGLIALVSTTMLIGLASYAAYASAALSTFPGMRLSVSRFSARQVREVTAFSLYLFVISIAFHVASNVDNVIIGAYVGTSAIALYTVAVRLSDYQRQLCGQFSGLLFPVLVRFDASRDVGAIRATLLDGTRIALGMVGGVTVCLLAFGGELVSLWMGPGFTESIVPLYVLALAGVVVVAQGPTGSILLAAGRHRLVAGASILEIAGNVALSLALVSRFGLTGVAIGTAVPYAILNIAVLVPVVCRMVNVSLISFAVAVGTPTVVAALPAIAAAAFIRATTTPASLATVIAQSSLVGLIYVVVFCVVGLRASDRARYLGSLRRIAIDLTDTRVATS